MHEAVNRWMWNESNNSIESKKIRVSWYHTQRDRVALLNMRSIGSRWFCMYLYCILWLVNKNRDIRNMYFASMKQLHSISIMSEDAVNMGGLRFEVGWGTSKERCEGTCLKTVSDLRLNKSDFVTQKHLSKSPPSRIFVPPTRHVIADTDKIAYIPLVH